MPNSSAVIIPVFNEGERVLESITASRGCRHISEVIVVNDGSTDGTEEFLENVSGITVLEHPANIGKGQAMNTGVQYATEAGYEQFVFLDGDLRGIKPGHIDQLLKPLDDNSFMSIGYLGLRKAVVKRAVLNKWGALSGQRALKVEVWDLLSEQDKRGFNIEAALNARLRCAELHKGIARVALEGVGHVGKREKTGGAMKALWGYTKTYSAAMATYLRIEAEDLATR